MLNKKLSDYYKQFSLAEGNNNIASEFAIKKIQELLNLFSIKNILEVGLGIGSISGSLLNNNSRINYTGTEQNRFCLDALKKNLGYKFRYLKIYPNLESISRSEKFDLIIIDGIDKNLKSVRKIIKENGIIAVEGDRRYQVNIIKDLFPKSVLIHSISIKKNKPYSPFPEENWQSGIKIIFINPTLVQFIWCVKERILTSIKYQFPKRYLGSKKNI